MTEAFEPDAAPVDPLRRQVAVGVTGTLLLNVTTVGLNFALTVVLSRLLGADGYGAYAFALAWALVLTSIAGLGLSPLVVRQVAETTTTTDWGVLRGVLRWSNTLVLAAGAVTTAVAGLTGWLLLADGRLRETYLVGLLLVVPLALTMLRQSAMQGLGKVILGRLPESVLAPGLFLLLAGVAGLTLDDGFSSVWAIALQVSATAATFAVGALLLARSLPFGARQTAVEYRAGSWTRSGVPLFALGLLLAASGQLGTIVLGALDDAAAAGQYAVATRLTTFIGFVMLAATYPLMPLVARLHAEGAHERLRTVVAGSARTIFLLSAPIAVAMVALAEPLLGLFGSQFGGGVDAVRILAVGEVAKAFVGLAGLVLVMTGHEARLLRAVATGTALNLVLALVLVPLFGVDGAAIATATGVVATQVLLELDVRRRAGVSGAAFGPRPPRGLR